MKDMEMSGSETSGNAALYSSLSFPDWRERKRAVESLLNTGQGSAAAQIVLDILRLGHSDLGALNAALQLSDHLLAAYSVSLVPNLVSLMEDPDPETRMYATLALGDMGVALGSDNLPAPLPELVLPALLRLLDDPDQRVRFNAVEALGKLPSPLAVDPLLRLAQEGDFYLAFPAIGSLAAIGDPRPIPVLLSLLPDDLLGGAAVQALGRLGSSLPDGGLSLVAPILDWLESEKGEATSAAVALASLCRETAGAQPVEGASKQWLEPGDKPSMGSSPSPDPCGCGSEIVPVIVQHLSLAHLQKLLAAVPSVDRLELADRPIPEKENSPQFQESFLGSLACLLSWRLRGLPEPPNLRSHPIQSDIQDPIQQALIGGLLSLLHHEPSRPIAARALSGARLALPRLVEKLSDPDREVRQTAAILLAGLLPSVSPAEQSTAVEALLDALDLAIETSDDSLVSALVTALGNSRVDSVFEALISLVDGSSQPVRRALEGALCSLALLDLHGGSSGAGVRQPYSRFLQMLRSDLAAQREAGCRCLAYLFAHKFFPAQVENGLPDEVEIALLDASQDADLEVKRAALEALPFLRSERGFITLAGAARSDEPSLRLAAARGLAQAEPARALPLLTGLSVDQDAWVRVAACRSLGALPFPQAIPPLLERLHDTTPPVRIAALDTLLKIVSAGRLPARQEDVGTLNAEISAAVSELLEDPLPEISRAASDVLSQMQTSDLGHNFSVDPGGVKT